MIEPKNQRLYYHWLVMKDHCRNNMDGLVIPVWPDWENDLKAFVDWAVENGYPGCDLSAKDDGVTLERIDKSRGYAPDNCRWVRN